MIGHMKILFLNTSERIGGAALAAERLAVALKRVNVEVHRAFMDQTFRSKFRFYWERMVIYFSNHFNRKNLFTVSLANTGEDVSKYALSPDIDIIHLHWINQGFLSMDDLERLVDTGKPIVWTMHDMWPCTGICHHARECEKYRVGCEACPFLHSSRKDLSTAVFEKKLALYKRANISFVCCSEWLAERAKSSLLMQHKAVLSIPNPIDTSRFHPIDRDALRDILNLPKTKRLILFGALNVTDKRKGIDYLVQAIKQLSRDDVELVVFGQVKENIRHLFPIPIHSMGYISNDDAKLIMLYNTVDLFVTPSLEENLPNMIMESMACGTPCVGFRVGGIPEMIEHKVNGYVADYKDADDLAKGINWVLNHGDVESLSSECVKKVHAAYAEEKVVKKYQELYTTLLEKR